MFTYLFALLGVLPFYVDQLWFLSFVAFLPLFVNKSFKNFVRFGVIYSLLLLLPFFKAYLLAVGNPFIAGVLFGLSMFVFFLIQFGLAWFLKYLGVFLPISFTLSEIFRSYFPFNGFPYYNQGEVLVNIPFLNLSLHYMTIFGATFLVLLVNYLIYKAIENWETNRGRYFLFFITLISFISVLSFLSWKDLKISGKGLKIAIVQPFISQEDKLHNEEFVKVYTTFLVSKVPRSVDLVLLPETAIPSQVIKDFVKTFKELNLIFGAYKVDFDFDKLDLYALNLAIFARKGKIKGIYAKRILVPFGEYTPKGFEFLGNYIPYLANIDYTAGNKTVVFEFKGLKLIPRICNEIFYNFDSDLKRGNIIVVLSNDAWFYSAFVKEHLRAVKVRAIETGKVFIFVNNNGWSGIIYPNGTYKGFPFQRIQLLEL
jgi:apolipoprotein N-acyltransferase